MAFQTFENDENNRGQIKRKNLKIEIRSTWLSIKNDYRILTNLDNMIIQETEDVD